MSHIVQGTVKSSSNSTTRSTGKNTQTAQTEWGSQRSGNREKVQDSFMSELLKQLVWMNTFLHYRSQKLWLISFPAKVQSLQMEKQFLLRPSNVLANNRASPRTVLSASQIDWKQVPVQKNHLARNRGQDVHGRIYDPVS